MNHLYEEGLERRDANFSSLTPVSFLKRSAHIFPGKVAIVDGPVRITYAEFYQRVRSLASSLADIGVAEGDTVSVLANNTHPMLECHYAVPMLGAVLNALNTRLDAATVRFILQHSEARV